MMMMMMMMMMTMTTTTSTMMKTFLFCRTLRWKAAELNKKVNERVQ